VLSELLTSVDVQPEPILAAAQSVELKQRLREQTDEAIRRGIFGAPSCTVGDELFWGNDRLEAAIAWAQRV
jgi:2-hydroxychromene-2-carboxylate isomerase